MLPLSLLQDEPVAKLSIYTRNTDTHRTLTWLVAQTATDKVLPSIAPTYRTHKT